MCSGLSSGWISSTIENARLVDSRGGLDGEFHAEVVETFPPSAWTCVHAPACWHEIALAGVKRGQWPPPRSLQGAAHYKTDQAATVGPTDCASTRATSQVTLETPSEDCVGSCVDGLNARWRGPPGFNLALSPRMPSTEDPLSGARSIARHHSLWRLFQQLVPGYASNVTAAVRKSRQDGSEGSESEQPRP